MEPVSFTFGIISFIHETIGIVQELKARWQATHENRNIIEDLFSAFNELGTYLEEIEKKFDKKRRFFSPEDANEFRNDFNDIKKHCQASVETLKKIKDHNVIKQTTRAISTNKKLTEMLGTATQDKTLARFWNAELGRVSRIEVIVSEGSATMISHVKNIVESSTSEIISHMNNIPSSANEGPSDSFNATFSAPSNPPNVVLDFDDETTHEGRLKKILLQHTGRNFASAISSKICGVEGMGGVGKSCALRGLVSCDDIREKYSGGIYFIVFGMDKKFEEIQSEIANIVQLSGGKKLCKEVNYASTLDFAIQLAVGWFGRSGKPCLFIVDDVWLTNGISTDILLSLSVLTQCHDKSSFCFSTRFMEVGDLAGPSGMVNFETYDPFGELSRKVLFSHAGVEERDITATENKSVNDVLNICGGLCVGLAVAGSSVKILRTFYLSSERNAWDMFLDRYKHSNEIVIKSRIPGGRRLMGYQPLGETIRVSLDIVQERIQVLGVSLPTGLTAHKMFQSFCVIKKRSYMSTVWLKWIWRFDSVAELRDVLLCFQQISLLDITWGDLTLMDLWQTVRVEGIRVHDLVLDYVHSDVDGKCEEVNWPEEILMSLLSEFIGPNTCREMTRTREFNLLPWYENEDVWEDILLFIKPIPDCYQFEYSYYEPAKGHAFKNAITCSYINALEFVMKNRSKKITSGKSKAEIHDLINRLSKRSMKLQKQIDSMGNTLLTLSELLYEDDDPEVLALLSSSHEGERVVKLSKMRIQFLEDGLKTM